MKAKPTITKAEIAEHFVTLEDMHESLIIRIKEHFANQRAQEK